MKEISGEDFKTLLATEQAENGNYSDFNIRIDTPLVIEIKELRYALNNFTNCTFSGKKLEFIDVGGKKIGAKVSFLFNDCKFENELLVLRELDVYKLTMKNVVVGITEIKLLTNTIHEISLQNFNNNSDAALKEIERKCHPEVICVNGIFEIKETKIKHFTISDSNIKHFRILMNSFIESLIFLINVKVFSIYFSSCTFDGMLLLNSEKSYSCEFIDVTFNEAVTFYYDNDKEQASANYYKCTFHKEVTFDDGHLFELGVNSCRFNDIASFQNINVDKIEIIKTKFLSKAFFDNITIGNLKSCDTITLRTIKQQLFLADNKIDYNTFVAYELDAYKRDISQKLKNEKESLSKEERKQFKNDRAILWLNSFYSSNGTDWLKSLKVTFWGSVIFYLFFFISLNYGRPFDPTKWNDFTNGFFRFFLVTDFHNPLEKGKVYLESFVPWLIFLFGKVFIAIGIYETIRAFRKYKK